MTSDMETRLIILTTGRPTGALKSSRRALSGHAAVERQKKILAMCIDMWLLVKRLMIVHTRRVGAVTRARTRAGKTLGEAKRTTNKGLMLSCLLRRDNLAVASS